MNAPFEPTGIVFDDLRSGRLLLLVAEGQPYAGWLCYRHPDGQWVTLREATDDDRWAIEAAEPKGPPDPAKVLRLCTKGGESYHARAPDPSLAELRDALEMAKETGSLEELRAVTLEVETSALSLFRAKVKGATALVVHPDTLEEIRGCVDFLGRPDLELIADPRLERGILYAIDQDAIDRYALDPYRKTTP